MPLTDFNIKKEKFEGKPHKVSDGNGMYILVTKSGKYFRFNYIYGGKFKTLALGVYPAVSLKKARKQLAEARLMLAEGIDPALHRREEKQKKKQRIQNTFEVVARDWFQKKLPGWVPGHSDKIIRRLELYVFPTLGSRPIAGITPYELLSTIQKIADLGYLSTAHRVLNTCKQIFRSAKRIGIMTHNPADDLHEELPTPEHHHLAFMTDPQRIGELMRAIEKYAGTPQVRAALRLAPLVFLRPGELRHAEWSEIDLDNAEWRIPGPRMKKRKPHIVPLAAQAVQILRELRPITGHGKYIFPSVLTGSRPINENSVLHALRSMGFTKEEICGHGFRHMASTILHGQGFYHAEIEKQLSHEQRNKVAAAYNHAEYLPERKKLMQSWADYLDRLKGEK